MCKLRCLTMNIFQKSPNFQEKNQKRQNWRAPVNNVGAKECQLKLSIYEDLGLRYVISVKTMSISKSNWSTILLFRLNSFLKAHLLFVALFNLLFSANKWWAKNNKTNFLNYVFAKFLLFWKIFLKSHIVTCSFHLEKWQKVGKNTKDGIETYFSHK